MRNWETPEWFLSTAKLIKAGCHQTEIYKWDRNSSTKKAFQGCHWFKQTSYPYINNRPCNQWVQIHNLQYANTIFTAEILSWDSKNFNIF